MSTRLRRLATACIVGTAMSAGLALAAPAAAFASPTPDGTRVTDVAPAMYVSWGPYDTYEECHASWARNPARVKSECHFEWFEPWIGGGWWYGSS
ncbi:hypothetical protein [Nonomuraea sp. NPDC049695]|uniref:hypothetical protein n=1 Tax=Nonomuraea sp. NPDC049695 TaxID=3154734 RepID=UPI00343E08E6